LPASFVLSDPPATTCSHAALMDRVYRHQRYIYDLTRRYYLFGRDRMIRELALRPGQSVVEVGCGTARNLIKIARRYPDARLFGLDASGEMLRSAGLNVARAKLSNRIKLIQGYAEDLSPSQFGLRSGFDHVLFPYSLSMIPDWRAALAAAAKSTTAEGLIHVVDFGDLAGLGSFPAWMLRGWLRLFHVEPRLEILRALEGAVGANGGSRLELLNGRYAFLWTTAKNGAEALIGQHVAAQTQQVGNSPA